MIYIIFLEKMKNFPTEIIYSPVSFAVPSTHEVLTTHLGGDLMLSPPLANENKNSLLLKHSISTVVYNKSLICPELTAG